MLKMNLLLLLKAIWLELTYVDDVQYEIDYYNYVIYCYFVGANPPIYVTEGYI